MFSPLKEIKKKRKTNLQFLMKIEVKCILKTKKDQHAVSLFHFLKFDLG